MPGTVARFRWRQSPRDPLLLCPAALLALPVLNHLDADDVDAPLARGGFPLEILMTSSRLVRCAAAAVLCCGLVLAASQARPVARQAPAATAAAEQFSDSHFHLTNYIQEGTDVRKYVEIMGTRVKRSTLFGIPLQQTWDYGNTGDFAPDLLPADRCAALLLLVHRRVHRHGLPVADTAAAGAPRPDDHRLQPDRHVRRRSHPPGPDDLSRRVLRHRRVHHPQGVRLPESGGRYREPDRPGARPHPGFRGGGRAGGHPAQRRRHAVPAPQPGAVPAGAAEGTVPAASEDLDHLGPRRNRPDRAGR